MHDKSLHIRCVETMQVLTSLVNNILNVLSMVVNIRVTRSWSSSWLLLKQLIGVNHKWNVRGGGKKSILRCGLFTLYSAHQHFVSISSTSAKGGFGDFASLVLANLLIHGAISAPILAHSSGRPSLRGIHSTVVQARVRFEFLTKRAAFFLLSRIFFLRFIQQIALFRPTN